MSSVNYNLFHSLELPLALGIYSCPRLDGLLRIKHDKIHYSRIYNVEDSFH